MKIAVFTVNMPEFSMEEIAEFASLTGYDGIELRVRDLTDEDRKKPYSFWGNHKNDIGVKNLGEKAKDIRKICDIYKIKICGLGTYLSANEIDQIEEVCKHMGVLNCKQFRVRVPRYSRELEFNTLFKDAVKNLKKVEKVVKKYKVKALIEIHMNSICPSAGLVHKIVCNFNPKYIGVIHDPGNMVYEGFENYKMGMQLLGDYLAHVHIKNSVWVLKETKADGTKIWQGSSSPLKEGVANLKQFVNDLKSVGYDKWLSNEDFELTDTRQKLIEGLKYIKSLLAVER